VFVDRDGVIIRNRDDYVKSWAELEFLPGAVEALSLLSESGLRVFVVTNQSAVGRGVLGATALEGLHTRLQAIVSGRGGKIACFLVCPHRPEDGCACRKPAPGLLHEARERFGVDLSRAYVVGDFETDVAAARAAGCTSILVLSGRTQAPGEGIEADYVVDDLLEAARLIVAQTAG
jgi:D-glycero-D-manno-heptose 1,7-bisphosphate phosphatase